MCTILVIDDEKAIARMIQQALSRFGYRVLIASDAKEGISMFDAVPVDLVMTDYLMPGLNGLDVVRHVRGSERGWTPVIAMTGTPAIMTEHEFDIVITKPFSIYEMLAHVQMICPDNGEGAISFENN